MPVRLKDFRIAAIALLVSAAPATALDSAGFLGELRGIWYGVGEVRATADADPAQIACRFHGSPSNRGDQVVISGTCNGGGFSLPIGLTVRWSAKAGVYLGKWNGEPIVAISGITGRRRGNAITFAIDVGQSDAGGRLTLEWHSDSAIRLTGGTADPATGAVANLLTLPLNRQ